jgi:predicted Zn finger-like uncharacterized protein
MKFSCDKCNTRYSIADERVRGRVLKIRCKACNHVITVRESEGAGDAVEEAIGDASAPVEDENTRVTMGPPTAASEAGSDDWFVSFDGEQEGPLPLARALDRVRAERPRGKECYCWRAGFFVWLPVEDVPEFSASLTRQGPPPMPAATKPARTTGQQAAVKSPTGKQAAVKSPTGKQAAAKSPTGSQAAVKSPTGKQAAAKSPADAPELPAPPAHAPKTVNDLPPIESGPLGATPEAAMPPLLTRPEPRLMRKGEGKLVDAAPLGGSGPALSGPTMVKEAPAALREPSGKPPSVDTGPVPLPPPPDDLPIGEASGLISLSHLAKPSMANPAKEPHKPVIDTFGGVPVLPTPLSSPAPIIAGPGPLRTASPWMKWAALAGALATVGLGIAVVVLMARKPTVIVVPPAPSLDDGKKLSDRPITINDAPPPSAGAPATSDKRQSKRSPPSARAAVSVKPPAETLSATQRNLASLYRDESEHAAPHEAPAIDRGARGGGQVSQQAIMAVVTQNRRSLNLCYDRVLKHDSSLKSGRVLTHVKIGISGSVTGVNVPDPQYANSEIGQCIAQTIKHWHFPSADSEYETEFPIILQAN